jgi:ribosomal protein S18 acetylase RimI-like enzyme
MLSRLSELQIILATKHDLDRIMALIKDCTRDLESRGIHQWGEFYPTLEIIKDDIENESMYVMNENKALLGIVVVNEEQPNEYEGLNWSTREGRILVIHRLAVSPKRQNQGIAGRLLEFAEDYAANNGYASIRLDAYSGNRKALRLYEKHQYKWVGQVNFPWRDLPFYCYEKIL